MIMLLWKEEKLSMEKEGLFKEKIQVVRKTIGKRTEMDKRKNEKRACFRNVILVAR